MTDMTMDNFLAVLSSSEPVPGGGGACGYVVPAIGCTEPIAVALCVAKATETLGAKPEKIKVLLSPDISLH